MGLLTFTLAQMARSLNFNGSCDGTCWPYLPKHKFARKITAKQGAISGGIKRPVEEPLLGARLHAKADRLMRRKIRASIGHMELSPCERFTNPVWITVQPEGSIEPASKCLLSQDKSGVA